MCPLNKSFKTCKTVGIARQYKLFNPGCCRLFMKAKVRRLASSGFSGVDWLLLGISTFYLFICPYNKVEESFNTQAAHDILFHGLNLKHVRGNLFSFYQFLHQYDHHDFPGVVPRTFLGAIAICVIALPYRLFQWLLDLPKWTVQYAGLSLCYFVCKRVLVREALGLLVVGAFARFRASISRIFGQRPAMLLGILTALQFHFLFYSTRTLPNTFALVLG